MNGTVLIAKACEIFNQDFINNELMEDVRNVTNLCILESSDINNDIDENLQKYITLLVPL